MKRFVSNFILGLFVVVLVVVYGVSKQPTVWTWQPYANDQADSTDVVDQAGALNIAGLSAAKLLKLPNGRALQVFIADTEDTRIKGLSDVSALDRDKGLLMVYPEAGQHSIWMQGVEYPIDVAWLNQAGEVVYMVEKMPPADEDNQSDLPVYTNPDQATYVLEVAEGVLQENGIQVGTKLEIS